MLVLNCEDGKVSSNAVLLIIRWTNDSFPITSGKSMVLFLSELMLIQSISGLQEYFSLFLPNIFRSELEFDIEFTCVAISLVQNVSSDGVNATVKYSLSYK